MKSEGPQLSVVVPIYNGASFIVDRMNVLATFLEASELSYELLLVDDGSTDDSAQVLEDRNLAHAQVIRCQDNRGKFAAIQKGVAQSSGACCIYTDADVPYQLDVIHQMAHHVLQRGFHVIAGDRTLPGSLYLSESRLVRRVATWAFSLFVRTIVTGGLWDTQCGIKAIRGDVAREIFPMMKEHGFAGDVELLYLALKYNLEIKRIPVRLAFQAPSSVHAVRDGLRMAWSLLRIRKNHHRLPLGGSTNDVMEAIALQDDCAIPQDQAR